ncbi:MAG: acetate--CoA ligase family protein [Actinomycetia bacterium]|nr:acetate--CoA ligase family protein [Actinomycetes bacterium]
MEDTGFGNLEAFFWPRSVAVVGATAEPARIGGRPLWYLRELGYAGRLYPVNPRHERVQGLTAYPSVEALPEPVDLALVAVPPEPAREAIRQCVRRGVRAAVVLSAGYAEVDAAGRAVQETMAAEARAGGLRLLGPNCLGLLNAKNRLMATFAAGFESGFPPDGPVALVTQSGAFGSYVLSVARQTDIPVGYWIATGNEADVDVAEAIRYFADRPDVRVIGVYLEGTARGDRLRSALGEARARGRSVVVVKAGRSDVGRRAVGTHTAALVGDDAVYEAVFREAGAFRARTVREFVDVLDALARDVPLPAGPRTAVVTVSGGVGILMADQCREAGLDLAPPSEPAQEAMRRLLPFAATGNPLDVTAQVSNRPELLGEFLALAGNEEYEQFLVFLGSRGLRETVADAVDTLARFRESHPEAAVLVSTLVTDATRRLFHARSLPVFEEPSQAVAVARALAGLGAMRRRKPPGPVPSARGPLFGEAWPGAVLGEAEAADQLEAAGIPWVRRRRVLDPEAARAAAAGFPGPVVLKGIVPGLLHKTEARLVRTGVPPAEAGRVYRELEAAAREAGLEWRGALVEETAGGRELFVGIRRDPVFGPTVAVGFGGILVEVWADVAVRLAPVTEAEARAMVTDLRGAAALGPVRGGPAADVDAFARLVARASRLPFEHPDIAELELNPVFVGPEGALAADAVVRLQGNGDAPPPRGRCSGSPRPA